MAQFSINEITKENPNRWFFVMNGEGESGLILFGYAGDQGVTRVITGQPTINAFLTEDDLEIFVNEDVGIDDYYKVQAETLGNKFQGPSLKYPFTPPE